GYTPENSITSNEALQLENLPKRILVIGGGYIAVEFACIFHGLGSEVALAYRGEQILRGFDDDLRDGLATELKRKGIALQLNAKHTAIERTGDGFRLTMNDGHAYEIDTIMCATGRVPNTRDLGAAEAGVDLDELGAVKVDAYSRSSQPN